MIDGFRNGQLSYPYASKIDTSFNKTEKYIFIQSLILYAHISIRSDCWLTGSQATPVLGDEQFVSLWLNADQSLRRACSGTGSCPALD
jgi:hypothetical protein